MTDGSLHVLLIGSGGREHALAWKLKQSKRLSHLTVSPGSDAIQMLGATCIALQPWTELAQTAKKLGVGLVVVGPDQPLQEGAVDAFQAAGIPCFGPTQAAAKLEWSKSFAKEVMGKAGIPTARFYTIESEPEFAPALDRATHDWTGCVVKADGLALGKGVQVCFTRKDTERAFQELFPISGRVVLEEFLSGEEVSLFAFCDGKQAALLDPARDYKRLQTGDLGPNTGGMGAFSPVPGLSSDFKARARREIFEPLLAEMQKRGTPYSGLLYAGLMVDESGRASVIEFNARFGDPETQALLPRMDGDLVEWCLASAAGRLDQMPSDVKFLDQAAVFVVAAATGYPANSKKGDLIEMRPIDLAAAIPDIFFAGAKRVVNENPKAKIKFETNGGRVLGTLGLGSTLKEARAQAYAKLHQIQFRGMQFRTDVAEKETR